MAAFILPFVVFWARADRVSAWQGLSGCSSLKLPYHKHGIYGCSFVRNTVWANTIDLSINVDSGGVVWVTRRLELASYTLSNGSVIQSSKIHGSQKSISRTLSRYFETIKQDTGSRHKARDGNQLYISQILEAIYSSAPSYHYRYPHPSPSTPISMPSRLFCRNLSTLPLTPSSKSLSLPAPTASLKLVLAFLGLLLVLRDYFNALL